MVSKVGILPGKDDSLLSIQKLYIMRASIQGDDVSKKNLSSLKVRLTF
jgi:hypothetical protein